MTIIESFGCAFAHTKEATLSNSSIYSALSDPIALIHLFASNGTKPECISLPIYVFVIIT